MTSEFLDDRARARKDDETNAQPIEIFDPVDRKFATKTWREEGLNVAQAKYIGWDLNMYDEASGKFASCNTTSLAQEIGQVKWIFSDKTGTLTRNEMRLVAICINNRVYGRATNKQLEELAREKLSPLDASRSCFTDVLDVLASSSEPGEREKLQHFFTALALCHTVLVESSSANHPVKDSTRLLRRSSLTARSGSIMHATTLESAVDADGVHVAKKKRSPNQRRLRMTLKSRKHASEVVLQARQSEGFQSDLNEPSPDEADDSENHEDDSNLSDPVPTYNAESPDEEALVLGACALGFEFAYTEGKERKARLDEVAREIEVKLSILGLTAVEDRLQDGVPQTISILRAAKINIWLITGDKVETAINIGRSAELISQNSRVIMLTAEDLGISEEQQQKPSLSPAQPENKRQGSSFAVEANGLALEDIQDHILNVIQDRLARMSSEDDGRLSRPSMSGIYAGGYQSYVMTRDNEERGISGFCMRLFSRRRGKTENVEADANLALVVDGDTLHYIMSKKHPNAELEAAFLQLARGCGVVIACRTSPGQKADLVELVKANVYPTPTTLAIGDGANDVPMIEKGHVGVGISGKEGTHAANAADFTIAQFKFLAPLLLVHGRFGYIRVAKAISLTFFANLLFTFVSFFYNFICRFSGTPAFNNAQYVIFQAFIAIPVFVIGWLDRDTKWVYDTLRNPRLYDIGRLNRILHPAIVDAQILRGLVHGAFAFLLVFYNDYEASYLALSGSLFVVITCVLTVRQASVASCYTWGLLFGVCFNIVGCLVLVSLINFFYSGSESNIFNLDKWGRYYWNQLVASVFIISLLDYLAPLTYTQMRDLINRLRLSLHKARQTVDEDPHDALFDGRLVGSPATAHPTSAAFLGPPIATELQSPSDLRPTTPRGPGLSVVSEGEAEASDLESVRSTQERDVVMRY
ncbi:Phospholipid-transporting ATPase ID [Hondaea fermentalgiana]|uniref:Phospholipid-transporting ATPase ID n=1 Tax=Hondaea fermentalgiana TaxID=2315210 RepID=A0A2R5G2W6_9STRA|nr:Phospholipid-transporting ATPase ID [Hondaea fermentalgiana]|eukprot:GBG25376.1 Phospholipid-transporting ATPase ID [Hondaea fermentalgiana]